MKIVWFKISNQDILAHLKYKSQPNNIFVGATVKQGDLLGQTSTTGRSTGPHLHIGLKDSTGKILDVLSYIDFNNS